MDTITHKKKTLSNDSFSFPSTPNQDSDFEFGSITPDSPSAEPLTPSPADHLFLNGRLLPHFFPPFQHHHSTSRTNSIGSNKDSLFSSRSNSTNSSCSSARTSSSDSSERRSFNNKIKNGAYVTNRSMVSPHYQAYGCSQRWQYITPVPMLNRDGSLRKKRDTQQGKKKEEGTKIRNKKKEKKVKKRVKLRFGRRIFRWFAMACRQCHAMEPSKTNNKEI
ncbi:hypothetical protein VNO77_37446 [Canavalia gladiata]|uniref:Uncharacterized protein n=1 Tax=Canavalia gladiata TaxID=3824 RepID=A0AAN9PUS8_CANGL